MNRTLTFTRKEERHEVSVTCPADRTIWEIAEEFRYFLLAIGFHPNTIDKVLTIDDGIEELEQRLYGEEEEEDEDELS